MSIMKKWQEETIRRNYRKRIDNAKAVLNLTSKSITASDKNKRHRQEYNTSKQLAKTKSGFRHQQLTQQEIEASPLYLLLQNFHLQQYARGLVERGYGYDLTKFIRLDQEGKEALIDSLKVQNQHRIKVYTLINYIAILMDSISNNVGRNSQPVIASTIQQSTNQSRTKPTPKPKSETTRPYRTDSKAKQTPKIQSSQQALDTPSLQKNFVELNKQHLRQIRKDKTKPKNKSKTKDWSNNSPYSVKDYGKYSQSKISTTVTHHNPRGSLFRFADDACLLHREINGVQEPVIQQKKLLTNLRKKLSQRNSTAFKNKRDINYVDDNNDQNRRIQQYLSVDLQMQSIRGMYLSYDNATLTSNIMNIDIEELVNCFAREVKSRIGAVDISVKDLSSNQQERKHQSIQEPACQGTPITCFTIPPEHPTSDEAEYAFTPEKPPSFPNKLDIVEQIGNSDEGFGDLLQSNKQKIEDILKVSLAYVEDTDEVQDTKEKLASEQGSVYSSSFEFEDTTTQVQTGQSLRVKLKTFDGLPGSPYSKQLYQDLPGLAAIVEFTKNIVVGARMEKQAPIIALVYLNRLQQCCGLTRILTTLNWRNLVVISLLVASKIWDDTSLQNHSVAKVLPQYTTMQLNNMEKVFLSILDYRLNINQKEYTDSYFSLRRHIGSSVPKTVSLKPLTLEEIRRLEGKTSYLQRKLKQRYRNNDLRKSI